MESVKTFYEEYEDMLEEYLENVKGNLKKNNEKYNKLENEYSKILNENINLTWILEGQVENRKLSNEECISLSKLVETYYDMKEIEDKELFFLGAKDAYLYFKRFGILK